MSLTENHPELVLAFFAGLPVCQHSGLASTGRRSAGGSTCAAASPLSAHAAALETAAPCCGTGSRRAKSAATLTGSRRARRRVVRDGRALRRAGHAPGGENVPLQRRGLYPLVGKSSCSRLPSGTSAQKSVIVISVRACRRQSAGTGVASGLLTSHIPGPKTVARRRMPKASVRDVGVQRDRCAPQKVCSGDAQLFQSTGVDLRAPWALCRTLRT